MKKRGNGIKDLGEKIKMKKLRWGRISTCMELYTPLELSVLSPADVVILSSECPRGE